MEASHLSTTMPCKTSLLSGSPECARGFWGQWQSAFFDIRVFHSNTPSYCNTSVPSLYQRHEAQKKQEYGDHVREVEQASFTPLVFLTTDGMGREGRQ